MLQNKIITSCLLLLIAVGGFFGSIEDGKYNIITSLNANVDGNPNVYSTSKSNAVTENGVNKPESKCEGINCVAMAANSIFQVVTIIVSPAILLASWLMSPDWTSGDLFGLRGVMYKLWVTVSNIIYFVYAILLIIIALGTIFGNEKFGYKAMLPRLALGIIMVPFTWWFVQWTISLATVVTASVMTIPMEMVSGDDNSFMKSIQIPKKIQIVAGQKIEEQADTINTMCTNKPNSENCVSLLDVIKTGGGMYGSLLGYAYGVFQVQDFKNVNTTLKQINQVGDLANQVILGVLFFIVFGVLVLALIFMLMMRAIKLWMYAIFSPLFTIHFVLGKEMLGEKMGDFNIKEFIGLCFVPAVVGITLSFGLIVISAIKGVSTQTEGCSNSKCTINLFGTTENTITTEVFSGIDTEGRGDQELTTIKIGGLELEFWGAAKPSNTTGNLQSGLGVLGSLFGTIIIDIIALIFIWVAFMAAKGTSKAVGKAIEPFEKMGQKVGELGASLPKYTPLPVPGGSVAGMSKAVDIATQLPARRSEDRFNRSSLGQALGGDQMVSSSDLAAFKDRLKNVNSSTDTQMADLKKYFQAMSGKKWEYTDMPGLLADKVKGMEHVAATNYLKELGFSAENAKMFHERAIKNQGWKKEDNEMYNALKSSLTGNTAPGGKDGTNSSYTTTQHGGKGNENSFTFNLGSDIKFDADISTSKFSGEVFSTPEGKEKLKKFMEQISKDDFKKKRPGSIKEPVWNKLIEEMEKDGRSFKS